MPWLLNLWINLNDLKNFTQRVPVSYSDLEPSFFVNFQGLNQTYFLFPFLYLLPYPWSDLMDKGCITIFKWVAKLNKIQLRDFVKSPNISLSLFNFLNIFHSCLILLQFLLYFKYYEPVKDTRTYLYVE